MDMKTLKPILVFLITTCMFMTSAPMVQAVQPSPSSFHGTVIVNGRNVPAGTPITALINGVQYVSAATTLSKGKAEYRLDIPGDDPDLTGTQGGKEGDAIIFRIGNLISSQKATWHKATDVQLDLSAVLMPAAFTCITLDSKPTPVTTGEKPQSKVWTYDGSWFAVFPTTTAGASSAGTWVWRLVGTTWTEVLKLSTRTDTQADVLAEGTVVHILLWANNNSQLSSIEYVGGTYQLWATRTTPADLPLVNKNETATLALDSTGEMWVASKVSNSIGEIVVYHSALPYDTWDGPIVLEPNANSDDIDVITTLPNGSVGVFWSNQNTKRFGFRYHVDGAPATTWSVDEVPASQYAYRDVNNGMADDHMNVAVASDSTLYVAVKTSIDTSGYPKMALLVRRPDGTWDDLYPVDETGTRPLVLLDENTNSLTYIYTSTEGNNPIVYQQSSTLGIAFEGRITLRPESFNDVSSMKANIENGFVVIYGTGSTVGGQYCSKTYNAPVVDNIPDQTIAEGGSFATINLDDYVSDVDNTDAEMTWTSAGSTSLTVSIVGRVATITIPDENWNGSETITFRAADPGGLWDEDAVIFTVNSVNDPPVLDLIEAKSTDELKPLQFTATATDIDLPPDNLTFSLADGSGGSVPPGAGINSASGDFTWTPTETQGPGSYTFDVCVSDGSLPDCETISVEVKEVNIPPTAIPDAYEVLVNDILLVPVPGVLANDSDADLPANTLTAALVDEPTHAIVCSISLNGLVVYVPDYMWSGTDTFTYKVFDGTSYSEPVTVTITVNLLKFFLPMILE